MTIGRLCTAAHARTLVRFTAVRSAVLPGQCEMYTKPWQADKNVIWFAYKFDPDHLSFAHLRCTIHARGPRGALAQDEARRSEQLLSSPLPACRHSWRRHITSCTLSTHYLRDWLPRPTAHEPTLTACFDCAQACVWMYVFLSTSLYACMQLTLFFLLSVLHEWRSGQSWRSRLARMERCNQSAAIWITIL